MSYNINNVIYDNYIDYFIDNLNYFISRNINFINKNKFNVINKIKLYFNILTLKCNDDLDKFDNKYLDSNYNLYYSINLPIKINFNNFKFFYFNYNIINIPKINNFGDIFLNGHIRTPILYLKLSTKYIFFNFNDIYIKKYFIRINNNFNIYIYFIKNSFFIYFNDKEIKFNNFITYNNIILKNKYFNFSNISNTIYLLNLEYSKKYKVFNDIIDINYFLLSILNLEISTIVNRLVNLKLNKKFIQNNNNLINKFVDSILSSIFNIYFESINILKFIDIIYNCDKEKNVKSISTLLFRENLLISPIIHYNNQLNSLSNIINKLKINMFGYSNNYDKKFTVDIDFRKLQSDNIGLINIINTPDGETCGLLSNLSSNTIFEKFKLKLLNCDDSVLENFFDLCIVSKNIDNIYIKGKYFKKKNKNFKINKIEIFENNEFKLISNNSENVNKNLTLDNLLSLPELIIPFLFNDDPCRGIMGSKMQTQALPLVYSEIPKVLTKYNGIDNFLSLKCLYSLCNGVVLNVDNYKIVIENDNNTLIYYYLYPFNILDYNSISSYKSTVWEGEKVYVGKILAVPNDLKYSEFSLGFNNFVNYSFYNGYEHEDAIVINKNLVIDDILTSVSFDIYEDYLSLNKLDYIEITFNKLSDEYTIEDKEELEGEYIDIFDYNKYISTEEILHSKIRYELSKSKSKKFFEIFKLIFIENKKLVADIKNLCIKKGSEGRIVKYDIFSYNKFKQLDYTYKGIDISYITLRFFVFKIDRIKIGDKLCGRHGNKGVISKIVENIDLPYTSDDLCCYSLTSPIGALARVNLGQFLEGLCGFFCSNLNFRIKAPLNLSEYNLYSNLYLKSLFDNSYFSNSFYYSYINKNYLRNFKTGNKIKNFNLLSLPYWFKLTHTSRSKFQYRTFDSYSSVTQQPVKGKRLNGSQKFGEMEIWALESHGSSYTIKDLSFTKTNYKLFKKLGINYTCSESFRVLVSELKNVIINVNIINNYKYVNNIVKVDY